jgi:hypothetical protein
MSEGNILFMICQPCEQANQPDFGVKLAERSRIGFYEPLVPPKEFAKWLMKHARCGGRTNPDHFQLAHLFERNSDQRDLKAVVHNAVVN